MAIYPTIILRVGCPYCYNGEIMQEAPNLFCCTRCHQIVKILGVPCNKNTSWRVEKTTSRILEYQDPDLEDPYLHPKVTKII